MNAAGTTAIRIGRRPQLGRGPRARDGAQRSAPRIVGPAYVLMSCASLQTAAALATTVFARFGPAGTGALRFLAGAVVLMVLVRPRMRARSLRAWSAILAFGGATAATNLFLYEALARAPLGIVGTVVFLGPLSLALLRARRRLDLVWALMAGAGAVLLTDGPSTGAPAGMGFALLAAAGVAASIVAARRVGADTDGLDGLALAILVAAVITLPVSLPAAFGSPDLRGLGIVAGVGLLGIAIPYGLEFSALRRVGVRAYSILLSLDPAFAALAGLVVLGQHLGAAELAGIALVMLASVAAVATVPPAPD